MQTCTTLRNLGQSLLGLPPVNIGPGLLGPAPLLQQNQTTIIQSLRDALYNTVNELKALKEENQTLKDLLENKQMAEVQLQEELTKTEMLLREETRKRRARTNAHVEVLNQLAKKDKALERSEQQWRSRCDALEQDHRQKLAQRDEEWSIKMTKMDEEMKLLKAGNMQLQEHFFKAEQDEAEILAREQENSHVKEDNKRDEQHKDSQKEEKNSQGNEELVIKAEQDKAEKLLEIEQEDSQIRAREHVTDDQTKDGPKEQVDSHSNEELVFKGEQDEPERKRGNEQQDSQGKDHVMDEQTKDGQKHGEDTKSSGESEPMEKKDKKPKKKKKSKRKNRGSC